MGTVRMSDLLEQARSFDSSNLEPQKTTWAPLDEGRAIVKKDRQGSGKPMGGKLPSYMTTKSKPTKPKDRQTKKEEVEDINELTAAEKKLINLMYDKKGNLTPLGKKVMAHGKKEDIMAACGAPSLTGGSKVMSYDPSIEESGHTDVASAMTNVKVAMSALTKMSGELSKLSPEDALPSWWTNKVAIAVDKLDGMADYLDTQVEVSNVDKLISKIKKSGVVKKGSMSKNEEVDLDEGTWHIAKNMNALKKRIQKPIPKGDLMVKFVMKHIGDDELADDMFDAKTGTDMVPMIKSAMKRLNIKEEVELDEAKFSPKEIKMAIGIASDKRYAGGNMTGAVKAIEKIHKGLSDHPQVRAVLKRQNEMYDSDTEHTKDPKSHVKLNKETGKYCVYDMKDKKVAEFDTKDEAEAYAVKNHDALMNEEVELDEGKMKDIVTDVEDAMGKIKYKLSQKGGKFIIRVSSNDEKDAQKAMKMNPLYIAGKLRVIPESFLIAATVDRITRTEARDIDPADMDVRATSKDVENASKNIILQLRKVINLRGAKPVEFASGKEKVHPNVAAAALTKHENMRRADDKEAFQRKIARSYKDLLNAVKGK
tara:strand:- start:55 stop:1836 length:1782 start_codon:yes stop_codon:yes gene_type:complete